MTEPTKEEFLKHVENHKMEIINDSGVCRHILFKKPNDSDRYFQITTWPNHLCISGDMGTYVFSRLYDMFDFFRKEKHDPGYVHSKMASDSLFEKAIQFSPALAERYVKEYLPQILEDASPTEKARITDEVLSEIDFHSGVDGLIYSLNEYEDSESGLTLEKLTENIFEYDFTTYTYHYLWCLHAIYWAIQQYDKLKQEASHA